MPELSLQPAARDQILRIGIIRFSALGDIVHTLPAFSSLKSGYPDCRVTWFVHPPGARLLSLVRGLDEIEVVTLKGVPVRERLRQLRQTVRKYRHRLDLVIDFQGLIKSSLLAALLGGKRLGFAKADLREPWAARCYTDQAVPFGGGHVIERNLHLLRLLGIERPGRLDYALQVPAPDPDDPAGLAILQLVDSLVSPLCLINLGGTWPTKQLTVEFWTDLLRHLDRPIKPLLIWGSDKERELACAIADRLALPIAPYLDFPHLLWLIRRSRLVVSADSLALHLADAMGVQSVGLFGPTDPARNGSLLAGSRWLRADVPCGYCYKRDCDKMWCRHKLSPIRAANLVNEVLGQNG